MTHPATVIGVDLGGTAMKLGRYTIDGLCQQELTVPTPTPSTPSNVRVALVEAIRQLDPQAEALAIGIGTPGPADAAGRVARVAINLDGWVEVPLADWLEADLQRPVILANDANCAGLGEVWLGAGQGYRDAIVLTLGTGVGGAIILNGELFVGRTGTAAELGLITLDPAGPPCNSGNQGSLEQYASIGAVQRRFGCDPKDLGDRAVQGDPEAIAAWQEYGKTLAAGLASLVYVLTPEVIILGGGISGSATFFLPALAEEFNRRVLPTSREGLKIQIAALGNEAGRVGAARLAWTKLETLGQV
ncbi:ROK family protein [Synechococcus elongatus]|uniref:ROK family protein n=1 Tax=Synechococcus elongatus PCC 11802 TaxID=2283154 RepID=A0AAT9JXN8_SYNEL|nr:ROK family protein [Synechococcus elongatus]QFZ91981.1 ROK family protein [Synechococcus elongatus PCC 11802]